MLEHRVPMIIPGDTYEEVDIIIRECIGRPPSPALRELVSSLHSASTSLWILDGYDEASSCTLAESTSISGWVSLYLINVRCIY